MSEEDFDIEEELGDGTFSIPHHSVSNQLKKIDKHQDDDMKVYITAVVSMLKGYEYNYLKRRYKSFDLIQNEELCDRYYKDVVITIEKEGLELSLLLSSTNDAISSQDVIRKLAQNFVNIYIPLKQKTQNVSYPWPTYDDDVQLSCLQLMQRNETAKSRSYMLGYFETVSRIPIIDQSEQGKIFTNSIAWALGRHPFGTYFTKIVIAVKSILHRVRLELSSGEDLCTKVRMIIDQTTQIWLWSWSKFEAAKLQIELAELLKECFQHIIFLAIPTLCQVFLNTSSYLALHAHENPFQRQNISFRSSGISDDSVIMKSNMNEVTAQLVSPSDSIRSATGSIQPTSAAIANTSDSRKPDSRSTSNQSLIIDSHPVVALETPFAVPIYNTADSMDGNDIVIANATVVDSTLSSVPIIASTTSSIQSQVVASGEALQHAYNTFSHSYTSVVPSQLAAPTPAVVLSSITNPYVPRSAVHFNRIIAIDELEEICGIPPRFRSMMLCQGTGNRTDINQNPFSKLFVDFRVLCQSRSPGEVNDVAVSIVDKIIQITSTNSSSSQNAANDAANPSSNLKVGGPETSSGELRPYSNSCIAAKDSLSADDLIPLIGFAFALYFQSLRVSASNPSVRTHNFRGTDRELMFALLRLADAFMLEHLLVRSTSYCLTSCHTALRALPVGL